MTLLTYNVYGANRADDWRDDAACRTEDAEDFFPVGGSAASRSAERHAKAVCFRCPSIQPCGQWALNNREPIGVWGGMSEAERRTILRRRGVRLASVEEREPAPPRCKRKPVKCGTEAGHQRHVQDKTKICAPCREAHQVTA